MLAPEVIMEIIKVNPEIEAISLVYYPCQKRLDDEPIIQIRTSIKRMLQHKGPKLQKEKELWVLRKDITLEFLNNKINTLLPEKSLGINSLVKCSKSRIKHIPMLDFRCNPSPENLVKIQEFLETVRQKGLFSKEGIVLFSGRSYHLYGTKLFSEKEWRIFLGYALLFMDFVDFRYIGHRLIEGRAALRISSENEKPQPKVIAIL